MRNVAVTEGDKTEAELRFGVSVNTWGVNDLVAAVDAVAEDAIDPLVAEYEDLYDVAPELRRGGERHDSLRYGARQELALLQLLGDLGATAFTTNFEDLGALRQLPGLAVQRLMAKGFGFGAEGDWKTAVLVRAAKVMGAGLPGGASLMEDYTYDLTPGDEKILGAHMLEICPTLTTSRPTLEVHPLGIGGKEDPVRLVFDTDPGPGVVVALEPAGRPRRVAPAAGLLDVRGVLAHGRRGAPHGAHDRGRGRGVRGLRRDRPHGAAGHRPGHDAPRLPGAGPLERRVLPTRADDLRPILSFDM
jgi:L-arabinose isomerase